MNEHGLEEICEPGGKQASDESSDICDSFLKYSILEAAASPSAVHLRMKVNVYCFILFHTVSYCFILFHIVSYCFILFHTVSPIVSVLWKTWRRNIKAK
jgi:hypothetical protein